MVDEATSSLDKKTAHQVSEAILNLNGITAIVVTHALEESCNMVYRMCNNMVYTFALGSPSKKKPYAPKQLRSPQTF